MDAGLAEVKVEGNVIENPVEILASAQRKIHRVTMEHAKNKKLMTDEDFKKDKNKSFSSNKVTAIKSIKKFYSVTHPDLTEIWINNEVKNKLVKKLIDTVYIRDKVERDSKLNELAEEIKMLVL